MAYDILAILTIVVAFRMILSIKSKIINKYYDSLCLKL